MQAEHKKRDKARKASSKPASRFEEDQKKRGLLDKYDEEEEEAAMLIGDQGDCTGVVAVVIASQHSCFTSHAHSAN